MPESPLLPSQRRWIAEYIESSGFAPADFSWAKRPVEHSDGVFPVLAHKATGFHVVFGATDSEWLFLERAPGRGRKKEVRRGEVTWRKARAFFQRWLSLLAREIDAAEATGRISEAAAGGPEEHFEPGAEDKPFNAREEDYLTASLDNIEESFFENQEPDSVNQDYWRQEFAGVRQAVAELGRLTWKRRLNDLRWNINLHFASKNLRRLWPPFNESFSSMLEKVGLGG